MVQPATRTLEPCDFLCMPAVRGSYDMSLSRPPGIHQPLKLGIGNYIISHVIPVEPCGRFRIHYPCGNNDTLHIEL